MNPLKLPHDADELRRCKRGLESVMDRDDLSIDEDAAITTALGIIDDELRGLSQVASGCRHSG